MPRSMFVAALLVLAALPAVAVEEPIPFVDAHVHLNDPAMQLEAWDDTAKVTFDRALLNELVSLRFIEAHAHAALVGPCGVGKTFLAHALGHIACRRGYSVLAVRGDQMLKTLKHARLDNTHEVELRRLIGVDLLIVDDFGLDAMDATESRDAYEILTERHRAGSMIVTSNRGPDEWLVRDTFRLEAPAGTLIPPYSFAFAVQRAKVDGVARDGLYLVTVFLFKGFLPYDPASPAQEPAPVAVYTTELMAGPASTGAGP